MSFFEIPVRWDIPQFVWDQSLTEMAKDGHHGCEGVAMWLGKIEGDVAVAERAVVLRGPGIRKRPDQLLISADLINAVTDLAIDHDLMLVGQIHSHGPFAGVDLSYPDRHMGIAVPGYLSIVVPDFALWDSIMPLKCGVHAHEGTSGWRRFVPAEIERRIRLVVAMAQEPLIAEG